MRPSSFIAALVSGAFFGFGLSLSGMVSPEVVLSFLQLHDFGLMLVMGGAMGVTLITYQLAPRLLRRPVLGDHFSVRPALLDRRVLAGSALFGVGWGLCGVCPGPAIAGLGTGNTAMIIVLVAIAAGAYLQGILADIGARSPSPRPAVPPSH